MRVETRLSARHAIETHQGLTSAPDARDTRRGKVMMSLGVDQHIVFD